MKNLNLNFQKSALVGKRRKMKEWNAKNTIEKIFIFSEISLEYKET